MINFNQTDAVNFSPDITGDNGTIVQRGNGTTTLTGANTYTGTTTVERARSLRRAASPRRIVRTGEGRNAPHRERREYFE